jgi:hypothetical protein
MSVLQSAAPYLAVVLLIAGWDSARAQDVYQWTDTRGTVHFSDSVDGVPPEYRDQITSHPFKKEQSKKDTPSSPVTSTAPADTPTNPLPVAPEEPKPKRYEVPYTAYVGTAKRIIVSVKFNESVTAPMALDTGAPGMLISVELARKLELFDEDKGRLLITTGGIGGAALAVKSIVNTVEVGGAKSHFVPTKTVVPKKGQPLFSDDFEGLIGMDFMSSYAMQVDPVKKVVIFEELPSRPDFPGGHDEEWWRNTFQEFALFHSTWKERRDELERGIRNFVIVPTKKAEDDLEFADWQTKEAEKLQDALHRYAKEHAVPMHWRTY